MNASRIQTLAGTSVPASPIVLLAMEYARQRCELYLFNHVVRSWLFAVHLGQIQDISYDADVVAVSTLLHDITLNDQFFGPRRFEVEAADQARLFARANGMDERRAQLVWDGVALNSTASIGLYKEAEVALCTSGIILDVVGIGFDLIPPVVMEEIVRQYPRLEMKKRMTQCFCHIAKTQAETTYDNFVRDFGERFVPDYRAPSSADRVIEAPFVE